MASHRPRRFLNLKLAVPLLAACLCIYIVGERQWRAREGEHLLTAARMAARMLGNEFRSVQTVQAAIAHQPDFIQAVARRDQQAVLRDLRILLDRVPGADRALVQEERGRTLAQLTAEPEAPAQRPKIWPAEPDQPAVSGVYLRDAASGEKVIGLSTPVLDGERLVGVLQTQYRLQDIARWLRRIRAGSGFLYLVDHEGFLVAHPYLVLSGTPRSVMHWAPVAAPPSAEGRLVRFRDGQPAKAWTAAAVMVAPYGWRVVAQQADAAMLKPFYSLVYVGVAIMLLLAVLAKQTMRPVRRRMRKGRGHAA